MRILFVSTNGNEDADFGGPKGSVRNYQLLSYFGKVDVYRIKKKSNFHSALSVLSGLYPPISRKDVCKLREKAKNDYYELVFFDGSIYGELIEIFSLSKRVVFYHNCEHDYNEVRFGKAFSMKKIIYQRLVDNNERIISQKADYRMMFSPRDAERIRLLYKVEADAIVPLGIEDKYTGMKMIDDNQNYCLMLGVVCPPNLQGYKWFIDHVSPKLHCKTIVAGKGFDEYADKWNSENVEVIGYVDNLEEVYANASCVVIPLFSGGGMKVKTVEALMFGKTIFGTDEAFSGFDFDLSDSSYLCNTQDEFINGINSYISRNEPKFNIKSRYVYEKKYSVRSTYRIFERMIRDLGLEANV